MIKIPNLFLPKEWRDILNQANNAALEQALTHLYQKLNEEQKSRMNKIFSTGTQAEKIQFLKENFPDLPNQLIKEIKTITNPNK